MPKRTKFFVLVSVALWLGLAHNGAAQEFSCLTGGDTRANFDPRPELKFVEVTAPDKIKEWLTRPSVSVEGFDAKQYGFAKVEFYRWHVAIPGRENLSADTEGYATDRLALAIRVTGTRGERWFELASQNSASDEMLYFQPADKLTDKQGPDGNEAAEQSAKRPANGPHDEMTKWVTIERATVVAGLPLFKVSYADVERGMYQVYSNDLQLLLDLRSGTPVLAKALTCDQLETFSGAGSAMDAASETPSKLQCQWDAGATDFRCVHCVPYGDTHAARTGQREFFLLSDRKVAMPADANHVPGLAELARRIRENPGSPSAGVIVSGLGPTTLLQRFEGVLPDTEVFVFASPGTGRAFNARFTLVTAPAKGAPTIQPIGTWAIGGETVNEDQPPEGYLPLSATDSYQSRLLEQRAGFRAFETVLKSRPENTSVHVVYWLGIEAVNGTVIANAVRLASDGYVSGDFGNEYLDSTASAIKRKAGAAEAAVRVQGQFNPEYTSPYPNGDADCVWDGALHWKAGMGFRVRKLKEDCQAAHLEVKITDEGKVQVGISK
jgi:hypothetical protein